MPRILHIVIASEWSGTTTALCRKLIKSKNWVVVHVDQKNQNTILPEELRLAPNLFETRPRIAVSRGDISIVQAIINSFYMVRNLLSEGDYINVLSGQDYPVKPLEQFEKFLDLNSGADFINSIPLDFNPDRKYHDGAKNIDFVEKAKWIEREGPKYYFDRINPLNYQNPHFIKHRSRARLMKQKRETLAFLEGYKTFNRISNSLIRLRNVPPKPFYAGSGWFTIRCSTMDKILNYYQEKKSSRKIEFIEKLKFSDEVFFQTILHDIGISSLINSDLRYVNWNYADSHGRPQIINQSDIDYLANSNAFFCRKTDSASIELIEKNLLR